MSRMRPSLLVSQLAKMNMVRKPIARPVNKIAFVAVAVQQDKFLIMKLGVGLFYEEFRRLFKRFFKIRQQVFGIKQYFQVVLGCSRGFPGDAPAGFVQGADQVDPGQEPAQLFPALFIKFIQRPAAFLGEYRVRDRIQHKECFIVQ